MFAQSLNWLIAYLLSSSSLDVLDLLPEMWCITHGNILNFHSVLDWKCEGNKLTLKIIYSYELASARIFFSDAIFTLDPNILGGKIKRGKS